MKAVNLNQTEFSELIVKCQGGPVPFVVCLPNDMYTPLSVFASLRSSSTHAFFLESVETGVRLGRYSFMGANPRFVFSFQDGTFKVTDNQGHETASFACSNPLKEVEKRMQAYQANWPEEIELPPLVGGLVGYMGYDCVHSFEPVGELLPDAIGMPEMTWMLGDFVVCFDHLHSQILLCKCALPEEIKAQSHEELYKQLVGEAEDFVEKHLGTVSLNKPNIKDVLKSKQKSLPEGIKSNIEKEDFLKIVERAKEHIFAGDIFQMVPSQRFSMPLCASAIDVYRSLRKINPSSYMFMLKLGDVEAVGSSPETQLRCEKGKLMMRPLAGTRPRTGDRVEDERLKKELLADEKECAEHRMLVDLVRNDLGAVAKAGSVKLTRLLEVEYYSHVMHITSEVTAELASDKSVYDAIRFAFPAGTLSGAPKVRAMQLINEFETIRRNMYGGLVGYIDFAGNSDSCIAIRMMMTKDKIAHIQAGAGIVADSDPETEFQETINKATAVFAAIAEAQNK